MSTVSVSERSRLLGRGVWLEVLTIVWNAIEALVAIAAGIAAGSVALVAFGLDSVIESTSGIALYRRLAFELRGASEAESEASERRALWFVGISFYLIAAYVLYDAVTSLMKGSAPESSPLGIALAAVSLVVMPLLAWAKLRTGKALGSRALIADAAETFVCGYLSFALLLGLGLNAALGWWWADPVAALLMLPLIVKEGNEAIESARSGGNTH
ncbi:MAG TPA: cation transporter [Gemmatimonadaceae bacterium]|nr:cation transporter [Gemmatimonadaceae bacterium]